jgi:hypothetical protein
MSMLTIRSGLCPARRANCGLRLAPVAAGFATLPEFERPALSTSASSNGAGWPRLTGDTARVEIEPMDARCAAQSGQFGFCRPVQLFSRHDGILEEARTAAALCARGAA